MSNYLPKILNIIIFILLGLQLFIYFLNTKSSNNVFSQKNITVENFSSIVLGDSGMTKIGSKKLSKIDDYNIFLEGKSYLENKKYKIYGKNISIDLNKEISKSDDSVKVINSMGILEAAGFQNKDSEGKIFFKGEVTFQSHD
tara:strand:- start:1061 stop:1486 length:426 start_codon:yes stop_codon:yes gene_type:complete